MEQKYNIKVISSSCGIKAHTLRMWEQRYNVFQPQRSAGGQRLYSEEDRLRANLLGKLTQAGYAISKLAGYNLTELRELEQSLRVEDKGLDHSLIMQKLLQHLSHYKIDAVANELQHLRLMLGAKDFIFEIVLPTLREVGVLVSKGQYSVTQEHIVSTLLRDQLAQIYLPNLGSKKSEVALATPEGNLHELSIIIADILCRANRVATRYLGAAHPADCLAEAIGALKSPCLVLGVLSSDQWDYQNKIIPYLKKLDGKLSAPLKIYLGGGQEIKLPRFKYITEVVFVSSFEEFDRITEVEI